MVFRKKYAKKRTFRKRKVFRKRKMFRKKRMLEQTMAVHAQIRNEMEVYPYTTGSQGVRMAIRWGKDEDPSSTNYRPGHILDPFQTYEWTFWAPKFAEYRIVGVKIQV